MMYVMNLGEITAESLHDDDDDTPTKRSNKWNGPRRGDSQLNQTSELGLPEKYAWYVLLKTFPFPAFKVPWYDPF
jgi:hypothetical protein